MDEGVPALILVPVLIAAVFSVHWVGSNASGPDRAAGAVRDAALVLWSEQASVTAEADAEEFAAEAIAAAGQCSTVGSVDADLIGPVTGRTGARVALSGCLLSSSWPADRLVDVQGLCWPVTSSAGSDTVTCVAGVS